MVIFRQKILIVDDEDDILDLLRYNLEKEGFAVTEAHDGAEALARAAEIQPDLVILDIMMPRMDGIEACRRLREHATLRKTPVIMLTARNDDEDHVRGLEVGADIYLKKPISLPILLSQVRAVMRTTGRMEEPPDVVHAQGFVIDRLRYVVEIPAKGVELRMPRKEFELLRFLAATPGRVFSRQEILDQVWGPDVYVVDRTVDVHVRKVREKIGDEYIETVKGVGYCFRP